MYAVIETGGKQYRATPGEFLEIESIAGDIGSEVEFNKVLAVFDGAPRRENVINKEVLDQV